MADKRIIDFIVKGLAKGHTSEELGNALLTQGWKQSDINIAFQEAGQGKGSSSPAAVPAQIKPKEQATSMGFLGKFVSALIAPGKLFEATKGEHDLNSALKFQAVILLIPVIIMAAISMLVPSVLGLLSTGLSILGPISLLAGLFLGMGTIISIMFYFMGLIGSFSTAGFFHIFALILRAEKKGFSATYKSFVYAIPVSVIGTIVTIAIGALFPTQPIIVMIVGLFFVGWFLFVAAIGLSHLHEISKVKAALVIIVPILLAVALIIIMFISMMFFLSGSFMSDLSGLSLLSTNSSA